MLERVLNLKPTSTSHKISDDILPLSEATHKIKPKHEKGEGNTTFRVFSPQGKFLEAGSWELEHVSLERRFVRSLKGQLRTTNNCLENKILTKPGAFEK